MTPSITQQTREKILAALTRHGPKTSGQLSRFTAAVHAHKSTRDRVLGELLIDGLIVACPVSLKNAVVKSGFRMQEQES